MLLPESVLIEVTFAIVDTLPLLNVSTFPIGCHN